MYFRGAMGKNKLRRFAENETFPNLFQPRMVFPPVDHPMKGHWGEQVFGNSNPLTLELGCGRGEYTVGLTALHPERNFVGIDWKGARLWRGAKTTFELGQRNAAFLRIMIGNIRWFFAPEDRVDTIWVTFPDPQLTSGGERKRLTGPRFLDYYRMFMPKHGVVNLKTDSRPLYDYTSELAATQGLKVLKQTHDLYQSDIVDPVLAIRTTYESRWLAAGLPICYLQFEIG